MSNHDKFNFFPGDTKDPCNKYVQPRDYSAPMGENGYPNAIPNTQTVKIRGGKAQTKGNKSTTRLA